jgi:FkbM family methyltransferase
MTSQADSGVLELKLLDGVTLAVPATLESITTYVLLEQETWFEKEMDFLRHWLRPGMTVIDIGANLGVYSLPIAQLVGAEGKVFAYEPAAATRALLMRSRDVNGAHNLEISAQALSDTERDGYLVFGESSELNALGDSGAGEAVRITSLDAEDSARGWPAPDFIKIDAEGEEERVLAGGGHFFARYSPLIMFEVKAGEGVNDKLPAAFAAAGYAIYRALAGAPMLVPFDPRQPLDRYELNLFAAKLDRAQSLSQQGVLVDAIPDWDSESAAGDDGLALLRRQAFAPAFAALFDGSALDPDYHQALSAYAVWRSADAAPATRCAALSFAVRTLQQLCERAPTTARLSTLARVSWEWGQRRAGVAVLRRLLDQVQRGAPDVSEPFWPACPRYDRVEPAGKNKVWFAIAAAEQFERTVSYSSCFSGASHVINWLCSQPFVGAEMERRRTLIAALAGQRPAVPDRLRDVASDHLNAEAWRAGLVPGTTTAP